jgi:CRP-like cAMP-binding protein
MNDQQSPLMPVVRRLEKRVALSDSSREAFLALPFTQRRLTPGAHIVRDGDVPDNCVLLLSGFAYRHKITGEGARQIISIHMPTEFVDLQNVFLEVSDHSVQALTEVEGAFIPRSAMRELALRVPDIGRALWIDTLIDSSVFREWVVNVGRRDSRTRVAHLLCEFSLRLQSHGLAKDHRYELPMTQEQLADATGLTSVHVNRVLKMLETDGLITRDKRAIRIEDWQRMSDAADFNERYLHHDVAPS